LRVGDTQGVAILNATNVFLEENLLSALKACLIRNARLKRNVYPENKIHSKILPFKERRQNPYEKTLEQMTTEAPAKIDDNAMEEEEETELPAPLYTTEELELISLLDAIGARIAHPRIWNSDATQLILDFNVKYTSLGLWMEEKDVCNHTVLIRTLHLLNFIAAKSAKVVADMLVQASGENDNRTKIEIGIDEFITQTFFLLAILGRNGTDLVLFGRFLISVQLKRDRLQ
jgi:hypothetical protein